MTQILLPAMTTDTAQIELNGVSNSKRRIREDVEPLEEGRVTAVAGADRAPA